MHFSLLSIFSLFLKDTQIQNPPTTYVNCKLLPNLAAGHTLYTWYLKIIIAYCDCMHHGYKCSRLWYTSTLTYLGGWIVHESHWLNVIIVAICLGVTGVTTEWFGSYVSSLANVNSTVFGYLCHMLRFPKPLFWGFCGNPNFNAALIEHIYHVDKQISIPPNFYPYNTSLYTTTVRFNNLQTSQNLK